MSIISELFVKLGLKKEGFDKGLNDAKAKTTAFGGAVGKIGGIIAGAFAASKILDFAKSAITAYDAVAKANAKMAAVIKATGGVAGVTASNVKAIVSELKSITLFSGTELTNASALLLTFPKVSKTIFKEALTQAANMSAVLGTDLTGSVIQLGKALNSPNIGLTALRRSGVSFTEEQIAMVKSLIASGKQLEAQKIILSELKNEFGGVAETLAKSGVGQWQMFQKQVKSLKVEFGKLIVESRLFKDTIQLIGSTFVNVRKMLSTGGISINDETVKGGWFNEFVSNLPEDVEEAKKALKKQIDELNSYADDLYLAAAKKKKTSAGLLANINPYTPTAKSIKNLESQAAIYEQQALELEKVYANIKPPVKKEDLTFQQQYNEAILDFGIRIKEAEEAARKANPGLPFIEASKEVANLKKELEEFIETYKKIPNRDIPLPTLEGARGVTFGERRNEESKYNLVDGLFDTTGDQMFTDATAGMLVGLDNFFTKLTERTKAAQEEYGKVWDDFNKNLDSLVQSGFTDVIATMAEGLGELAAGTTTGKDFGNNVLKVIGGFMKQLGSLMIAYAIYEGLFAKSVKLGPLGWGLALAAGVGMVAAGAAISGLASKGLGGTSAAASGYSNYSASSGTQALQGNVVFELEGTKLKGVLANTDRKNQSYR